MSNKIVTYDRTKHVGYTQIQHQYAVLCIENIGNDVYRFFYSLSEVNIPIENVCVRNELQGISATNVKLILNANYNITCDNCFTVTNSDTITQKINISNTLNITTGTSVPLDGLNKTQAIATKAHIDYERHKILHSEVTDPINNNAIDTIGLVAAKTPVDTGDAKTLPYQFIHFFNSNIYDTSNRDDKHVVTVTYADRTTNTRSPHVSILAGHTDGSDWQTKECILLTTRSNSPYTTHTGDATYVGSIRNQFITPIFNVK